MPEKLYEKPTQKLLKPIVIKKVRRLFGIV